MDPRVETIARIIVEEKNANNLSARKAASLIGVCEGHFLRLFRRALGTTFRRYKRAARIAGAAALMSNKNVPTKEAASVAGYSDVSNFHRDFKQVRGMSPRQWKMKEIDRQSQVLDVSKRAG
jgi:AraC-like DNA-binding protein